MTILEAVDAMSGDELLRAIRASKDSELTDSIWQRILEVDQTTDEDPGDRKGRPFMARVSDATTE